MKDYKYKIFKYIKKIEIKLNSMKEEKKDIPDKYNIYM